MGVCVCVCVCGKGRITMICVHMQNDRTSMLCTSVTCNTKIGRNFQLPSDGCVKA